MTKLVPIDELLEIVTEAGLLHQRGFYETSLSNLIVKGGDPLGDLSTAYELAEALGIPRDRLAAVIASRYPSTEDQLTALESQRAMATTRAVAHTYRAELLKILRTALPSRQFDSTCKSTGQVFDHPRFEVKWRRGYTVKLYVVNETQVPVRGRPPWRDLFKRAGSREQYELRRDEILLATIDVGNELVEGGQTRRGRSNQTSRLYGGGRIHIVITVGSGVFIKVCNAKLSELRERFGKHNGMSGHEVLYDYVVQEDDQLG